MHKLSLQIFFILTLTWGIGYLQFLRYPIYIYSAILIILTTPKISLYKLKPILFIIFPISMYLIIWERYSILYFLLVLLYIFFVRSTVNFPENEDYQWVYKSIVFVVIITIISLFLMESRSIYQDISSGIYPEYSHLGFTLGPALGLITSKKKYRFFGIGSILFLAFKCFSRSLIIGYFVSLLLNLKYDLKLKSNKLALLIIIITTVLVMTFFIYVNLVIVPQIYSPSDTSIRASSIIWAININKGFNIMTLNPLGVGPFGWIKDGIERLFIHTDLTSYNQRDMASLAAYGIASFGWLFFVYLFYIFKWVLNDINLSKGFYRINPLALLTISYIITACFRWTGITVGPLVGMLCLASNYNKEK